MSDPVAASRKLELIDNLTSSPGWKEFMFPEMEKLHADATEIADDADDDYTPAQRERSRHHKNCLAHLINFIEDETQAAVDVLVRAKEPVPAHHQDRVNLTKPKQSSIPGADLMGTGGETEHLMATIMAGLNKTPST